MGQNRCDLIEEAEVKQAEKQGGQLGDEYGRPAGR